MKTLVNYIKESFIREADDDLSPEELGTSGDGQDDAAKTTERGDIKFTIWESPDKKVKWLDDNTSYQKIECLYKNKEDGIEIDFLLGYDNASWKLWMGKNGAVSYDNKPAKDLKTTNFADAIVNALDAVEEIIADIKENPDNWPQYYIK